MTLFTERNVPPVPCQVERFSDGRMLLLVAATAKIRVLRPSQKVPFVLATVEKEHDEEESLVGALYPRSGTGLEKPSANKNGVRSSGPEWDPEVAAAAVMTHELRRREKELWDCYDQVGRPRVAKCSLKSVI